MARGLKVMSVEDKRGWIAVDQITSMWGSDVQRTVVHLGADDVVLLQGSLETVVDQVEASDRELQNLRKLRSTCRQFLEANDALTECVALPGLTEQGTVELEGEMIEAIRLLVGPLAGLEPRLVGEGPLPSDSAS